MAINNPPIIEKWVSGKFDSKINISLTKKGDFLNPSISIINGKSYKTKLGEAMKMQLGYNEVETIIAVLKEIQDEIKKESAKRRISDETHDTSSKDPEPIDE